MKFALIIPAAGSGTRSGQHIPKQYVELLGVPVLAHTLRAFATMKECEEIVIAIDRTWRATAEQCADGIAHVRFVPGGEERQYSIANALRDLGGNPELVLVHDAARPCVPRAMVERVLRAANEYGAAVPAMAITETVKRVNDDGRVTETIERGNLRAVQTPQGFRRELLASAYRHAALRGIVGTDDASLVEAYGARVQVVDGSLDNIKITVPEDFKRAEAILTSWAAKEKPARVM